MEHPPIFTTTTIDQSTMTSTEPTNYAPPTNIAPVILEIYVDSSCPELVELYKKHIETHNAGVANCEFPNSGFDLFFPEDTVFTSPFMTKMVDLKVKAQMWEYAGEERGYIPTGYYLYPRSSLAKTQLMLSNHVGVIDSGYRNNLLGAFRYLPSSVPVDSVIYLVSKHTRLLQICHPTLTPIAVCLLTNEEELTITTRNGGFGSTGFIGQLNH
jgi:dUTP pyrophosphatase